MEAASEKITPNKHNSTSQIGRKRMQDMGYMLEWLHHFDLVPSKSNEGPYLLLL